MFSGRYPQKERKAKLFPFGLPTAKKVSVIDDPNNFLAGKEKFKELLVTNNVCSKEYLVAIRDQKNFDGSLKGIFSMHVDEFPLTRLRSDGIYNRTVKGTTKEKVKKGFDTFGGFELNSAIFVDVDSIDAYGTFEIIDGQNRQAVAVEEGYTTVPVIFYKFYAEKAKHEFYEMLNLCKSSVNKKGEIHLKAIQGFAGPRLAYRAYKNENYIHLFHKIELEKYIDIDTREVLSGPTSIGGITITYPQFCHAVNAAVFLKSEESKEKTVGSFNYRISTTPEEEILEKVNDMMGMYVECLDYKTDSILRAFFSFYVKLHKQHPEVFMRAKELERVKKQLMSIDRKDILSIKGRDSRKEVRKLYESAYNFRRQKNILV